MERNLYYSNLAEQRDFSDLFPSSGFSQDFSTLDEAYDYINTATMKFSRVLSGKRRDKGLGAKLSGPLIKASLPVSVFYIIRAQDTKGAIDLSLEENKEKALRTSEAAYLFFIVFYNDRIISLSNFYLDPKYSGFSDGNAQIRKFRLSDKTYIADYPIGWDIDDAFLYLRGDIN
jgi:hypothetical protein